MSTELQERLYAAVVGFEDEEIEGLIHLALDSGMSPQEIMVNCLVPALDEVGRYYSEGTYFVPELIMCGNAVKLAMGILNPLIEAQGGEGRPGRLVMGTVAGDLHDIGKNMVVTMLKGSGYDVIDLGVDVSSETFVEAVREHQPDILALSALLLTTREEMKGVVESLTEAGLRDQVKVIIGGAPVDQAFTDQIGADGFGEDAPDAVRVANRLVDYGTGTA